MEELTLNLKKQIIEALNLKHLKPEDIVNDQPLFGDGLGHDSFDALELNVLLQQHYNIKLTDPQEGPKVFKSVNSIVEYIQAHKKS